MSGAAEMFPHELVQLIAQYGEDFTVEYGSEREAFDDFAEHAAGNPRERALTALDELLAEAKTEEALEEALQAMTFNYVVAEGGSASHREFLLRLRGWLVESLRERPPDSA